MDAIRIILACMKNADLDFNLINNNDRIAIGVSGGKDSMALLYVLNLYKKFSGINFTIIPITIDLGFDGFDIKPIENYVSSLGLKLYVADGKIVYQILKTQKTKQNLKILPCSICSRMKKAIINKEAHKYHCNKVAFAHHKTDAIETLFLNEIYGGRIATFSPKMFLSNEKITFIRPLIYSDEKDIKRLIKEKNIPFFPSYCPNDGKTKRTDIKDILLTLNKDYPESIDNFLTMLLNKEKFDVFYNHMEHKIENTDLYFKEIDDIKNFLIERKFIKANDKINKISHHIHIYKKDKLVGILLFHNVNKDYFITNIYLKDKSTFPYIICSIYKKIYAKVNPIRFFVKETHFKKELENMNFISSKNKFYEATINPMRLEKLLKDRNK